jgi:hypothetical protein
MEDCEVAFDNRFARAFGVPLERIRNKVRDALMGPIKAFIAEGVVKLTSYGQKTRT